MPTKTISKTNGVSKKQTSKKSSKHVEPNYKVKERYKPFNTGFEMSSLDKKMAERTFTKNIYVDEEKEAQIKRITSFTIDNNDVIQDYLEIPLLDKCIPNFETDFVMFFATAKDYLPYAAKDNPRNQVFSDTAKSVLRTAVYRPDRYLSFTSSFNIAVCDSYKIEKRDNKDYLILKGNVQVTDSATRSLLWEHMRRDGSFDESLEKVVIPFSVKLRQDYENDVEFAQACTAQNTSKSLSPYEKAYGFGCLNSVPARFGKYADRVVLKKSQAVGDKIYLEDLLKFIGGHDCTLYVNAITSNNDKLKHCVTATFTTGLFNKMIADKEKNLENFNPDTYFGFIDDIGENLFELYVYLRDNFLNDLIVEVSKPNGCITEKEFSIYINGKYTPNKKAGYTWCDCTLRMIYNALRYLIREDSDGKQYYICNPVELLKDDLFRLQLHNCMFPKLTVGAENFQNGERLKLSSIESRDASNGRKIYDEMSKIIDLHIKSNQIKVVDRM